MSEIKIKRKSKLLKDMSTTELQLLAREIREIKGTDKKYKDFSQFDRARDLKRNNYKLKLSDLDIIPMELKKDKEGKLTFNKKGGLRIIRKKR